MTTVTRMVPLAALQLEHKFFHNPRTISGLSDFELESLGVDIQKNGLIELPKVQQIKVGDEIVNLVWDGQRRVRGMKMVFPEDHEIEVIDRTEEPIVLDNESGEALLLDALRTTNREALSSLELCNVALRMRDRGTPLGRIGAAIGRDASWVSKMLKAHSGATPVLKEAWEKGDITDELFKDLAESPAKDQVRAIESVLAARQEGDASEARTRAKEIAAKAKADKVEAKKDDKPAKEKPGKADKTNGHVKVPPAISGDQAELWKAPPPVKVKKDVPAKAMLEDIVKLAGQRPPTHDYAKGVLAGIKYVLGDIESGALGKPWHQYIDRLAGKAPKKKGKAPTKKTAKPAKKKAKKK